MDKLSVEQHTGYSAFWENAFYSYAIQNIAITTIIVGLLI